jgi:glycine hydroxymethyltransferase
VEATTGERRDTNAARLGTTPTPGGARMPANLERTDPRLAGLIEAERTRQHDTLCLIPSENHASAAVREASTSVLTDKYSEGYPGKRYYQGNAVIDEVETLAAERARALFGADHANVQALSGAAANLATYAALLEPGDTVLGMSLEAGGHLTHGWGVSVTGRWFRAVRYGVRRDTGTADLDEVRELALRERPKLIWCGGTAIPRTIDFAGFAQVAAEAGAVLAADVAHIAGLIAGGAHPSPVGHAAVVSTTTHKTLRGPRGALLLCDADRAAAVDRAVFPGLQGGPHDHTTAAIAVALHEATQPEFADYARAVVANAAALATALAERGFELVSGGTDNHLLLVDLTGRDVGGRPAAEALERAGLVCNYNAVPFDPRPPLDPSGIRLGTPALTTRGLRPEHMPALAGWIDAGVEAARRGDEAALERIRAEVLELARAFPPPA